MEDRIIHLNRDADDVHPENALRLSLRRRIIIPPKSTVKRKLARHHSALGPYAGNYVAAFSMNYHVFPHGPKLAVPKLFLNLPNT